MILSGIPQSTTPFGGESTSTRSFTTYTTRNGTIITSILLSAVTIIPTDPPITHGPASVVSSISTTTASPIPPIHGTAAESMSHESGHSTPLIAATATASALFLLIIVAGVWLYKKRLRRKDAIAVFHLGTFLGLDFLIETHCIMACTLHGVDPQSWGFQS